MCVRALARARTAAALSQLTDYVIKYYERGTGVVKFVEDSHGLPKVFFRNQGLDEDAAAERAKVEVEPLGHLAGVLIGGSHVRQGEPGFAAAVFAGGGLLVDSDVLPFHGCPALGLPSCS